MTTLKTARLTGFLYILVIILAGFSQGAVREILFIPGDALATATNIAESQNLFRTGLVTDMTAFILDAIISVLFYFLLKPVSPVLAMVSSALRLIAHPAIGSLNLLNHYMALEVLNGDYSSVFNPDQIQYMVHGLMTAHNYGYLIAGAIFGAHLAMLGILLYRSVDFPKVFGILMVIAAIGYLMESYGDLLFPGNESWLAVVVGSTAAVGEVSLAFYLAIKGVRNNTLS